MKSYFCKVLSLPWPLKKISPPRINCRGYLLNWLPSDNFATFPVTDISVLLTYSNGWRGPNLAKSDLILMLEFTAPRPTTRIELIKNVFSTFLNFGSGTCMSVCQHPCSQHAANLRKIANLRVRRLEKVYTQRERQRQRQNERQRKRERKRMIQRDKERIRRREREGEVIKKIYGCVWRNKEKRWRALILFTSEFSYSQLYPRDLATYGFPAPYNQSPFFH